MKTRTNIWTSEKLSFHAKGVYELLHHYANPDNGECWPGVDTLSRQAGLSRPTIRKAINELAAVQMIEVRRRKGYSTHYVLQIKKSVSDSLSKLSTTGQGDFQPPGNDVSQKERSPYVGYLEQENVRGGNVLLSGQRRVQPVHKQTRAMQSLGLVMMETEDGEVLLYDAD